MDRTGLRTHYAKEIKPELDSKEVVVGGWLRSIREHGRLKFLVLEDKSGSIQITAKRGEVSDSVFEKISLLGKEWVILVRGKVKKNSEAPKGVEMVPTGIDVLSKTADTLPLGFKVKAELDTRLDWRVLDLRDPKNTAIFKIQSKLIEGMTDRLRMMGFIQVFTPCLIGAASEGGADVFSVAYFDKRAYLRQDPQLHRELLIAAGFDKIFDLGPSWRAEPSHTPRHLCEHRGCAVELSFIRDEIDTIKIEEELVVSALQWVKKDCREELELLDKDIKIPRRPFPELRFPEVYDILEEMGKKNRSGEGLDRGGERLLGKWVEERHKHEFCFVNRFPFESKPFYVMRVDEEPHWARSVDLMFKGLELSSGGQREHRYDKIIKQAKEKNLALKNIEWFTKFFKYGVPPMGGFNLGIERLTQKLLDLENIREATPFPRAPERLLP
jgi:aspartyl-tRNA synthetase